MKLKPSDYIIQFLSEYRHEQAQKKVAQKPEYKVCEVIGTNTYMITSKHIGYSLTVDGIEGYARPLWCLDIFGSLDHTRPYSLSALSPHWIWSENLTDDLYLDDDSPMVVFPWGKDDDKIIFWDDLDLSGDINVELYNKQLKENIKVAISRGCFPENYKPMFQKIIVDAWLKFWSANTYKFKVHNWLNFGLPFEKHVTKIHKLTVKSGRIYVSYELKNSGGKKCSTILSQKQIDDLTSSCERYITYAPRFDGVLSKGDKLIVKAWEILQATEDLNAPMEQITTVHRIGCRYYRIDRQITDEHLKPHRLELPKDYKYAPADSIYDAVFHPVIVGNNSDVASNFYIDPLAHSLRDSEFYKKLKQQGKPKTKPKGFAPSHGLKSSAQELQEYDTFNVMNELDDLLEE